MGATNIFVSSSRSSWYLTFFLTTLFKVHKFAYFTEWFSVFSKFSFFNKTKKQAKQSLKSLCDKSLKKKNVIRPNSLSVRDDRRGIWLFSRRHYSRSINLLTTWRDFYRPTKYWHFLRLQMIALNVVFSKNEVHHDNRLDNTPILVFPIFQDLCI